MSQAGEIDVIGNNPEIPTSFVTDAGIAVPIANVLEILGIAVAAGTTPVETTGSGNTVTIEVQTSQAIAAQDATKIGLANFNSSEFTVTANGFVSLVAGVVGVTALGVDAATAPGVNPVDPTAGGLITIGGAVVANHSVPIETRSRALNVFKVEAQYATSAAATDGTKSGLAHFNSTQFSVDASGFVALAGGGQAIDSVAMQTGTSPIVPTAAGLITLNGAVVAAGINPIRTNGTGANTGAIEVQISQALAATDATKIGLCNFSNTDFSVDANGFVSVSTTGVGKTITGQSGGALSPTANNWNISGAVTAAGTSPVVTSGAVSTLTVNVQTSQALAVADATKIGLSNFDSTSFAVDATGFVTLSTTGVGKTITGNSGGALSPTANNWNILGASTAAGTSPVTTSGALSTLTVNVQKAQALAATDATKIGLANFDSAAFDVDANGFVQLNGGGIASTSFDVQANTAPGTDPVVPTAAGVVTVNGAAVANHSVVLETRSRAANAYNLEIQYAASAAATDSTKSGVAHFNSTQFSVDANGFVALAGGGLAVDSIGTQTGTNPIVPTAAGLVTINGATVAAGTNPVRSNGTGANTMAMEVQISQALAATDATKIGLSNFNSSHFSVDANGFVALVTAPFTWTDVTSATQALAVTNGYFTDRGAGVTYTLPASAALGDIIIINGKLGLTTIAQNANQAIRVNSLISTTGVTGSVVATNVGDCITLRCSTAGASTIWIAESFTGNWTVT